MEQQTEYKVDKLDQVYKAETFVVAGWILHYWERRKEYEECAQRYQEESENTLGSARVDLVPIHGSLQGDPTGRQGVSLASLDEKLDQAEKWLGLVEELEERLPWRLQLILRLRWEVADRTGRSKGRPSWIPYVQHRYCREVAKRHGKAEEECWVESPRIFTDKWNKIVAIGTVMAAKRGLI